MHAELGNSAVNRAHADLGAGHRPNGTAATGVISNLEKLQSWTAADGNPLQDAVADAVGCHVTIGVGRHGNTHIQSGSMVLEVNVKEVRVDRVDDIGRDQEAVGNGLWEQVGTIVLLSKGFGDAFHDTPHEVGACTLAQ